MKSITSIVMPDMCPFEGKAEWVEKKGEINDAS